MKAWIPTAVRRGTAFYALFVGYGAALLVFKDITHFRFPFLQPLAGGILLVLMIACLLLLLLELYRRPEGPRASRLFVLSFLFISPFACDYVLFNDELVSISNAVRLLAAPHSITFFNYGILTQLLSILISAPVLAAAHFVQNGVTIPTASTLSHTSGGGAFQSLVYFSLHLSSILLISGTPLLAHRVARRFYSAGGSATVFLLMLLNVSFAQHAAMFLPHVFLAPLTLLALLVVFRIDEDSGLLAYLLPAGVIGVGLAVFPASYPLVLLLGAVLFVDRHRLGPSGIIAASGVLAGAAFLVNALLVINKLNPGYVEAPTGLEWIVPAMIESGLSRPPSDHVRAASRLAVQLSNGMSFPVLSVSLAGLFVAASSLRHPALRRPMGFLLFLLAADILAKLALHRGEIRFLFSTLPLLLLLVPMAFSGTAGRARRLWWAVPVSAAILAAVMAPDILNRVWFDRSPGFEVPYRSEYLRFCLALWACVFTALFMALTWMARGNRRTAVRATLLLCASVHSVWFSANLLAGSNQYRIARHLVMRSATDYAYVSSYPDYIRHWTPKSSAVVGRKREIGSGVLDTENRLVVSSAFFDRYRSTSPVSDSPGHSHVGEPSSAVVHDFYGQVFRGGEFRVVRWLRPPPNLFDGVGFRYVFPYMFLLERDVSAGNGGVEGSFRRALPPDPALTGSVVRSGEFRDRDGRGAERALPRVSRRGNRGNGTQVVRLI